MSIFNMSFLLSNIFWLVVSTHLKNMSQDGNIPQIGLNIKNIWNHRLPVVFCKTFHGTPNQISSHPSIPPISHRCKGWHSNLHLDTFPPASKAGQPQRGNTRGFTKPCEPLGVSRKWQDTTWTSLNIHMKTNLLSSAQVKNIRVIMCCLSVNYSMWELITFWILHSPVY